MSVVINYYAVKKYPTIFLALLSVNASYIHVHLCKLLVNEQNVQYVHVQHAQKASKGLILICLMTFTKC